MVARTANRCPTGRLLHVAVAVAMGFATATFTPDAQGQEGDAADEPDDPIDPIDPIRGVEEEGREPGDAWRSTLNAILWFPRQAVEYAFLGSQVAVGVIENQPVVPEVQRYVTAQGGKIAVLPTAFVDSESLFSVGARMIAEAGNTASTIAVGFGGIDNYSIEPRVAFTIPTRLRSLLKLELLYEHRDELEYAGLGQVPAEDERNAFVSGRATSVGLYFERRVRAITSYSIALTRDLSLSLSTGINRRWIEDPDGVGAEAISRVFEPSSVPGLGERWTIYSESAFRLDTRESRGRPSEGMRAELYTGTARELRGEDVAFLRAGGRFAGFIPVFRETNIFSVQGVLDGLKPLSNHPVPFWEIPRQPDFRGKDTRQDLASGVINFDYRWLLVDHVAPRLFFDFAAVGPGPLDLGWSDVRYAGGIGIDVHTEQSEVARIQLAMSPEGPVASLSIGVEPGYGDRQHRD